MKLLVGMVALFLDAPAWAQPRAADDPGQQSSHVPADYQLVWADEFAREGLPDPTKWKYDTHANKRGSYNKELQYYSARRLENARVENGRLLITARQEKLETQPDYGGQRYTSARLVTQGTASWTYGFFEIRAKLPCGAGSWPAIWTLGSKAGHPDGGEIDILEHVGNNPGQVHGTVHNRATAGTHGDGGSFTLPTACSAFHRYQLTWTPEELAIAVDGKLVHRYAKAGKTKEGWPFDSPQYLLLNLAIGGAMGGQVGEALLPITFEIDYVRIYQRRGGLGSGPIDVSVAI